MKTGSNIPSKHKIVVNNITTTDRKKGTFERNPVLVRPRVGRPVAGTDLQRHCWGGGAVLSFESDEVNIEVDLIGLV